MTIEKQEHKDFLIALLQGTQIPGKYLELAAEVLKALKEAKVDPPPPV